MTLNAPAHPTNPILPRWITRALARLRRRTLRPIALAATAVGVMAACGDANAPSDDVSLTTSALSLGDSLGGISASAFADAKANFMAAEGINDGLGPIFNERACGNCHSNGAPGGAGENIERRFGRFANGAFNPLANEGGSLRQLFSLGNFNNPNLPPSSSRFPGNPTLCSVPIESEPADTTVHNVGRLTTPLFGLGLVDAMPDSFFDGLAAGEPSAVRGIVNRVSIVLPNPADSSQTLGGTRVGRFGWKAGVPNLAQFSADAYVNEMGITTQHCFHGTSVTAFATESAPNGVPVPPGCDDLAPPAPAGVPAGTDDAVGSCAGGLTELQDDVQNFTTFMTFLAPPSRDFSDQISVTRGQPLFAQAGCAGCHSSQTFTTPNPSPNGVPGNFAFNPYSDFLLHDMGSLGDQIGNQGDSLATTRRMRTAPLWGVRFRNHLLHDGRTSDVGEAIRAHDGQGAAARDAFNALGGSDQHNLTQFVRSL